MYCPPKKEHPMITGDYICIAKNIIFGSMEKLPFKKVTD